MRLPDLRPEDLDPEHRALYDDIVGGPRGSGPQHFPLTTRDGALSGPFAVMIHGPALGRRSSSATTAPWPTCWRSTRWASRTDATPVGSWLVPGSQVEASSATRTQGHDDPLARGARHRLAGTGRHLARHERSVSKPSSVVTP